MRYVLFSRDPEIVAAFRSPEAFLPSDVLSVVDTREAAVEASLDADMVFVDLIATLDEPHKIAGYEAFHDLMASRSELSGKPVVVISLPYEYEIDFMVGWQDFVFANMPRPVTAKLFRRASTWI